MSHIFQKGNRWYISIWHKGKQHRLSLKIPASIPKKEVKQKFQSKIDFDLALGKFDPEQFRLNQSSDITLFEFLDKLTKYYERRKLSHNTIESYKYSIQNLKNILEDIPLNLINNELADNDVLGYLNENYSYNSVRHYSNNFRTFFNKAISWGYIKSNPFSKLVPPKKRIKPRYFSLEEIQIIKKHFSGKPQWQYDLVFLALNTGLRKSELVNLKWTNVDFQNQHLIFKGKGDNERIVPLNRESLSILSKRKRRISDKKVFFEIKNTFAIDSAWRNFKNTTGIKIKFHVLRSTFASYYIMGGGSLIKLMEILGHTDYSTVLIYSALSKESLKADKDIISF